MKKIALFIVGLMTMLACQQQQEQKEAGYIVQISLGGWLTPDYTAEQIIGRIDTVSQMIPVQKVIIGWSQDKEIYRKVGEYLHDKNIRMLLWLPVFAETEEVCETAPQLTCGAKCQSTTTCQRGRDSVSTALLTLRMLLTWWLSTTSFSVIAVSTVYSWTASARSHSWAGLVA